MLYYFLSPYINSIHIANLLHYITFRAALALICSLLLTLYLFPKFIYYLLHQQKLTQPIREFGVKSHHKKSGTPTMGGVVIVFASIVSILIFADLTNTYVLVIIFVKLSFTALGFYDDYLKTVLSSYKGVSVRIKMLVQILVSTIAILIIKNYEVTSFQYHLTFPFFKKLAINLGYFYIPFAIIVITGASNAVNLTDGLDGLVSVPLILNFACFAIIAYIMGNKVHAAYLKLVYIPKVSEIVLVCSSIIGATLGFLWYNCKPAEIFMGDTGSLALGGAIGTISVITKHEIVLAIIGGLFVLETLSVILQVYYFKLSGGKRLFKMAPLHHHFEQLGWPESKVVVRFWIISVLFSIIGLMTLKIR